MRLVLTAWAVLVAMAVPAVMPPPAAHGSSGEEPTLSRWGIGWDSGIAVRCRLSSAWGLGLRLNPNLYDEAMDSDGRSASVPEELSEEETEQASEDGVSRSYGLGLMLYREARLGDWLRAGPFVGISYSYQTSDLERTSVSVSGTELGQTNSIMESTRSTVYRSWAMEVGVRPAFWFHERFVLETRIGLRASYGNQDRDDYYSTETATELEETRTVRNTYEKTESLSIKVLGQDLGFGAVMQFVVFF